MLTLLRTYAYWSILWGFLANPGLGMRSALQVMLPAGDIIVMCICATYITLNIRRVKSEVTRQHLFRGAIIAPAIFIWSIGMTALHGGDLLRSTVYIAALLRPLLLLMALLVYVNIKSHAAKARLQQIVVFDITLLVLVQLSIASLQIINPTYGRMFIGSLNDLQSASAALDQGDVSGTFANSIELAYFLIASYVGLSLRAWERLRPPLALVTAGIVFFVIATGSVAASVCIGVLATYFHLRGLSLPVRLLLACTGLLSLTALFVWQADIAVDSIIGKLDNMMLSRLGLIFISLPNILQYAPFSLLTGRGTDFEVILSLLVSMPEVPHVFNYENSAVVINDVFWVALLLGLGLPATGVFLVGLSRLLRSYITANLSAGTALSLFRVLVIMVLLAGLLNQILLVRSFTTTLMLALLPLAALAAKKSNEKPHTPPQPTH